MSPPGVVLGDELHDLEDELEGVAQLFEGIDREMSPPGVVLDNELYVTAGLFDGEINPHRRVLGDQAIEEHDHEVQVFSPNSVVPENNLDGVADYGLYPRSYYGRNHDGRHGSPVVVAELFDGEISSPLEDDLDSVPKLFDGEGYLILYMTILVQERL